MIIKHIKYFIEKEIQEPRVTQLAPKKINLNIKISLKRFRSCTFTDFNLMIFLTILLTAQYGVQLSEIRENNNYLKIFSYKLLFIVLKFYFRDKIRNLSFEEMVQNF